MTNPIIKVGHSPWSPEAWTDLVQFAHHDIETSGLQSRYGTPGARTANYIDETYSPEVAEELLNHGDALILDRLDHALRMPDTPSSIAQEGGSILLQTWRDDANKTSDLTARHIRDLAKGWEAGSSMRLAVWGAIEKLQDPTRLACNALAVVVSYRREHQPDTPRHSWDPGHQGLNLEQGYSAESGVTQGLLQGVDAVTKEVVERQPGISQDGLKMLLRSYFGKDNGNASDMSPEDRLMSRLIPTAAHLILDSVKVADKLIAKEVE